MCGGNCLNLSRHFSIYLMHAGGYNCFDFEGLFLVFFVIHDGGSVVEDDDGDEDDTICLIVIFAFSQMNSLCKMSEWVLTDFWISTCRAFK